MSAIDCLLHAAAAILRHPLRSSLSIVSIAISIAALMVTVSIGSGARYAVDKEVRSLGADLIVVNAASATLGGARLGAGTALPLTDDDLARIQADVDGVSAAAAFVNTRAQVVAGGSNWNPYVQGVSHDWFAVMEWGIGTGRPFDVEDIRRGETVAVLGSTVARELFGDDDPIGQTVRIRTTPFRVIGVAEAKGGSRDDVVFVPLDAGRRRVLGFEYPRDAVMAIFVKLDGTDVVSSLNQMTWLLRETRRVPEAQPDDFTIRNLTEITQARGAATRTLTVLIGWLAAVSLLVAGVGIMNMMTFAVTERTAEIGLRLAIGARPRDIRMQFLAEAALLSLAGGLLGIALGAGAGKAIAHAADWPIRLRIEIIILALSCSASIGVLSAYLPARRASRINPVDALQRK